MSEQQKIKVGDTVVIRGEVLYVDRTIMAHNTKVIVSFKTKSGWAQAIHINHIDEVIPAPVIPKAGEVWTSNLGVGERHVTVLFADENGVYYERFGTINPPRGHLRLNMFLGRYGKDDGSD